MFHHDDDGDDGDGDDDDDDGDDDDDDGVDTAMIPCEVAVRAFPSRDAIALCYRRPKTQGVI